MSIDDVADCKGGIDMEIEKNKIKIPAGCFEGNCSDCRYANWSDTKDGKPYCEGRYGGYNRPSDRNGCFHWHRK